jgi:ubiquinone/menaquinone biosynthesis C-methylase UbiE
MNRAAETAASAGGDYVLGRTPAEYERLREQAQLWELETGRLLDRAGLGPGGRCLDVGSGPGEVMRLMADRVGPGGEVVGIDVDESLGAQSVAMLESARHRQCRFAAVDVEADPARAPGAPFDLVFARLLLIHVDDPAAVIGRLWEWVAPGGCLVIQDYDILSAAVVPELEVIEEFTRVAQGAFLASGSDLRTGLRLPALHEEAGVGVPDGIDAGVRIGPLPTVAPLYEAVFRSVLPRAIAFGLTTERDGERWLEWFAEESARAHAHTALWSLLIGTWKRKLDPQS